MDPILRRHRPDDPVATRSFAVAVFLHALGHPIEHVVSLDDGKYNILVRGQVRFRIVGEVHKEPYRTARVVAQPRRDLERFYTARNAVNALTERALSPHSAESEKENPLEPAIG